jgi:hypothetical protein
MVLLTHGGFGKYSTFLPRNKCDERGRDGPVRDKASRGCRTKMSAVSGGAKVGPVLYLSSLFFEIILLQGSFSWVAGRNMTRFELFYSLVSLGTTIQLHRTTIGSRRA